MKTLESIKNFGKKVLVGGLVLSGLATGCGSEEGEKILIEQKLDNNYTIKIIENVLSNQRDTHQFIMADSSGNKVIDMQNIYYATSINIEQNDNYILNILGGEIKYNKK